MRLQRQTLFGDKKGNCFSTCIACMFDLDVDEVPNFCAIDEDNWQLLANEWLQPRGYYLIDVEFIPGFVEQHARFWGVHFASGDGPRGCRHQVIMEGFDTLVWDPHPSDDGLIGNPRAWERGFLIRTWRP